MASDPAVSATPPVESSTGGLSTSTSTGNPYISVQTTVRWGDCDPAGIAYFPHFFEWMDLASHVLARELGVTREDMLAPRLLGFPLVTAHADFLSPARMDDVLEIQVRVARIGRTSLSLVHDVVRIVDGTVLARGREDRVHVGQDTPGVLRPRELSPAMRAVLERYAIPA